MKENILKQIQKFINRPFYYSELLVFTDKQKDLLLLPAFLNKIEENQYNALWDLLLFIEEFFAFAKAPNYVIASKLSILLIYGEFLKERNL